MAIVADDKQTDEQADEQTARILRDLFRTQRFAALATSDEGQPYQSLMAFVATPDLRRLIFATERRTRKYANLVTDPRAAFLIDNRSNQAEDVRDAVSVTATGLATEAAQAERDELVALYLARHPYLEGFVRSPSCALMVLEVACYTVVTRFRDAV